MKNEVVAKYTLKFNDLASKRLLRTARAAKAVTRALKTASLAAGALTIAAAGAAIKGLNAWAEATDDLGKAAQRLGVGIGVIDQLKTQIELAGGESESAVKGVEKFSKAVGEAKLGTGQLITILKKSDPGLLGDLLESESVESAFQLAMKAIKETDDVTKKAALTNAFFGRSSGKAFQLLAEESAEVAKRVAEIRPPLTAEHAKVAAEYNDQVTLLKRALLSVVDASGGQLAKSLTVMIVKLQDFIIANREIISSKLSGFFSRLSSSIGNIDMDKVADSASVFVGVLAELAGISGKLVNALGGPENAVKVFVGLMVASKVATFSSAIIGVGKGVMMLGGALKFAAPFALGLVKGIIGIAAAVGIVPIAIAAAVAAVVAGLVWMSNNFDKVKAFAKSMGVDLDAVWLGIKTAFGSLVAVSKTAWSAIQGAISNPVGTMKGLLIGLGRKVLELGSKFGQFASKMFSVGKDIVGGLVQGILAAPKAVFNALKGVVLSGVSGVKSLLGINSPSRVFAEIGSSVGAGFTVGVIKSKAEAQKAIDELGRLRANDNFIGGPGAAQQLASNQLSSLNLVSNDAVNAKAGIQRTETTNRVILEAKENTVVTVPTGQTAGLTRDGNNFSIGGRNG